MNGLLKKILPDTIVIAAFAIISLVYMFPATQGKVLTAHDASAGIGAGKETADYRERTGEISRWTNALFSGMPTFQSAPSYPANTIMNKAANTYHLFLPPYIWYVFAFLLGFYILMRAFDFKVWMAALGAIIWAFSSYFFIIIAAGHIWKVMTLAYIPPTIAGIVLAYKGKYILGGAVTALFASLQLLSNHVQMTYYFLFVIAAIVIAFLVDAIRHHEIPRFIKASSMMVLAGLLAVGANSSNLYHTWQYSKETMRGKGELVKTDSKNQTKNGLERDYITQWSYGIDETLTLLIPNFKGGASSKGDHLMAMSDSKPAMKKADKKYVPLYKQLTQYWGEQPMTAGPVYVGAIVCLLFIMGLIIFGGPLKWALLAATLLSVLLSWGHNMQWFTDLFIDYMPMYSKFRTVSSILVIAEFTIPLLAMLGLREFFKLAKDGKLREKLFFHGRLSASGALWLSLGVTGGLSLLFALFPALAGNCISSSEASALNSLAQQYQKSGQQFPLSDIIQNLTEMRRAMLSADALRSLLFILCGFIVLSLGSRQKIKIHYATASILMLCLIDLWIVDKRYMSDDLFSFKKKTSEMIQPTSADLEILKDKSLDYRVLNLASNTFNENETSYFHKSIGGYHAAKLRRYQEMIENHIAPEMRTLQMSVADAGGDMSLVNGELFPVLNMLNTKYFIFPGQNSPIPIQNPYAYGNAWFVGEVKYVADANEEIDALRTLSPKNTAIVDFKFKEALGNVSEGKQETDTEGTITITSYEPNKLEYDVTSATGGLAVFSEIFYPGWKAVLDGKEYLNIGRADYVLRALNLPSGTHKVTFTFDPTSLHITNTISYISLALMLLGFIAAISFKPLTERKGKKI